MAKIEQPLIGANEITEQENKDVNEWMRFGMRLGTSAALHPLEYAKVLIQLGYEPVAPRPGKSLVGRPIMLLPNLFQYTGYLRKMDGVWGCYRGLTPKLIGSVVGVVVSETVAARLGMPASTVDKDVDESLLSDEEIYMRFKLNLKRDVVMCASGIIVAQPFHVISLRMMAQFIGRETLYRSIFSSVVEIYNTEGLRGFFSGVVPKLLCDVACLVLTSSTVYMLNKYVIKDKVGRQYNAGVIQFALSSLLYPLQVVSTCMAVTGSRLMAGSPPIMPMYFNWVDCWNDLQQRGDLKRGNSLFWRSVNMTNRTATLRSDIPPLPVLSKYQ